MTIPIHALNYIIERVQRHSTKAHCWKMIFWCLMVQEKKRITTNVSPEMVGSSLQRNYTGKHTNTHMYVCIFTLEFYPQSIIYTFRDMCVDSSGVKHNRHSNTDTLINQVSQMKHSARISTSVSMFKVSTAQWVPQPNRNSNGPWWVLLTGENNKNGEQKRPQWNIEKNSTNSQINRGRSSQILLTERRGR